MDNSDENNEKESINEDETNNLNSIDLTYDLAVLQYDRVMRSVENLNTKAIGIITLDAAILSIGGSFISNLIGNLVFGSVLFGLLSVSYIFVIVSMILSGYAFKVDYYPTMDISKLHNNYYKKEYKETKDQLSSNLGGQIKKILEATKKMKKFINLSIIFAMIGVILLTLSNLLSLLM